jgi:hypothetical protein
MQRHEAKTDIQIQPIITDAWEGKRRIITKDNFIGFWFVELGDSNYTAALLTNPAGQLELGYRFRYYVDDKIGSDSKDVRHFYRAIGPGKSQAALINHCRELAAHLAEAADTSVFEIMMDEKRFDEVLRKMEKHPAFHLETLHRASTTSSRVANGTGCN